MFSLNIYLIATSIIFNWLFLIKSYIISNWVGYFSNASFHSEYFTRQMCCRIKYIIKLMSIGIVYNKIIVNNMLCLCVLHFLLKRY